MGAIVRLYPADYVPSQFLSEIQPVVSETTDALGTYEFEGVASGIYNIEGEYNNLGTFIDSVNTSKNPTGTNVPSGVLKKVGVITGISHMAEQNDTNQVRAILYMPGTGRLTKPIIGGKFTFDRLPEGRYQLIIDPTLNEYDVKVLNLSTHSGDTLNLDTVRIQKHQPDTIDVNQQVVYGVWGPNKTYRINSDIDIPAAATLTVLPHTKILMMGNLKIHVFGNLIALGKPDSMIVFTYGFQYPSFGSWLGMDGGGNPVAPVDTVVFKYCLFEFMAQGIRFNRPVGKLAVSNCVFRYSMESLLIDNDLTISNTIFHDIQRQGIGYAITAANQLLSVNNIFLKTNIAFRSESQYITANNTDFFQVDTIGYDYTTNSRWTLNTGTGNIYSDPKFLTLIPGSEDYHLLSDSPCRGTGVQGTDMGLYSTYVSP